MRLHSIRWHLPPSMALVEQIRAYMRAHNAIRAAGGCVGWYADGTWVVLWGQHGQG